MGVRGVPVYCYDRSVGGFETLVVVPRSDEPREVVLRKSGFHPLSGVGECILDDAVQQTGRPSVRIELLRAPALGRELHEIGG